MAYDFADSLKVVLVYEGGKVDNDKDPGGRTNKGITQSVYTAYRRGKGLAPQDVYLISDAEVMAIYKVQYWDRVHGDTLRPGVNLVMFDSAVHSGVSQGIKWLQKALGVPPDGAFGLKTQQALDAVTNDDELVGRILDARLLFLQHLSTWKTFGKGWASRVSQLRIKGQAWAAGTVGPTPAWGKTPDHKALITDAKPAPMTAPADAITSGGPVAAGLSQVGSALTPVGDNHTVAIIIASITVAGVVLGGAGFWYGQWARKKAKQRLGALDINVPPVVVEPEQIAAPPDAPAVATPAAGG